MLPIAGCFRGRGPLARRLLSRLVMDEPVERGPERLAGEQAPARRTPAALHEDALSATRLLRERAEDDTAPRVGNGTPTGPVISSTAADDPAAADER